MAALALLQAVKYPADAFLAFWKSDKKGLPANGGRSKVPAHVGMIEEIKGPLHLCGAGALHATLDPDKWSGERVWLVALHGEVAIGENKVGALKREILAEVGAK